jgi:phosphoribosylformimino-5-aminoimidazole carboxamide ribotide isomerase
LRTKADVERVLSSGAAMVNLGTIAAENTELIGSWAEEIGAEKFLIGADSKDGKISVSGWERSLDLEIFEFIERLSHYGLKRIFVTDISRDGVLKGPATGLYSEITRRFPEMELTASGGIRSIDDIKRLEKTGCNGAIVGRAIYEGKITLDDIKDYVGKKNHSMP